MEVVQNDRTGTWHLVGSRGCWVEPNGETVEEDWAAIQDYVDDSAGDRCSRCNWPSDFLDMRWRIHLDGDTQGLQRLSEQFDDDPHIFREDDGYLLWSSRFEELGDPGEIRDIGKTIAQAIRNFGEFDSLPVQNLEASGVDEIRDDGSKHAYRQATVTATAAVSATARAVTNDGEHQPRAESTYEHTKLALQDDTVYELTELRDNGEHWVNLYRIYEFIQDNIEGEDNIVDRGWWSNSEKSRFKRTANSPDAIGHEARHAQQRYSAPPSPMEHENAKSLINELIKQWLQHRTQLVASD